MSTLPIKVEDGWLQIRKPLWEAALEAQSPQACAEILQAVKAHVASGGKFCIYGGGQFDGDVYLSCHDLSDVDKLRAEAERVREVKGLEPLPRA